MTLTLDVPRMAEGEAQQEKLVKAAVSMYDAQIISTGQAAQLAGLSLSEFIEALGRYGVPLLQYSAEEAIAEASRP